MMKGRFSITYQLGILPAIYFSCHQGEGENEGRWTNLYYIYSHALHIIGMGGRGSGGLL